MSALHESNLTSLKFLHRGKVRDLYEVDADHLLIVQTDRLSAFDVILPTPIPGKGVILSLISTLWMRALASARPHHLLSDDPATFPEPFAACADRLRGRAQLVRRAQRIDVECVVRGYLTGSGLR